MIAAIDNCSEHRTISAPPIDPTPYTLHPAPYTLHPTPYTLHPTPYTLIPKPSSRLVKAQGQLEVLRADGKVILFCAPPTSLDVVVFYTRSTKRLFLSF